MSRFGVLFAVLALSVTPAFAQPPDPTDLARGLRENGMPDLAVEYLDEVAAKKPSATALAVIPLEKARALLDLADGESDDGRRASLVAEAKAGFEQFLSANPNHARRAEATIMLARVVSVEAKGILSRAAKIEGNTAEAAAAGKAERAKARPVFQDASKRFGQAAAEFAKKLDDGNLTAAQKKNLTRDVYQAELDRGINAYYLADTYDRSAMATAKDKQDRAAALDQAGQLFNALYNRDATNPLAWVARAWAAECEREKDNHGAAQKINDEIKAAARKTSAAHLGLRTATFFELRTDFLEAHGDRTPAKLRKVQAGLESWLADPLAKSARPAPEVYAARFYLGVVKSDLALAAITDKAGKIGPVTPGARQTLQSAERDFKRLTETENDYAGRAAERRTQVLRLLVGNAEKDPAAISNFEECLMTAQVQLYRAIKDEKLTEADRAKAMDRAVALYERARQLPAPKELARDAADAQANLVYTYMMAEKPQQAAVLGEYLAHSIRPATVAARAGLYGVQAYLTSAAKVDAADGAGRKVDQDHAAKLALFLDKQYPTDVSTDAARVVVGQQFLRDGRAAEAFEILSHVRSGSPRAQAARLIEASAAYELLRSLPQANGGTTLPADKKAEIYARAVADLGSVPDQPAGAPAHDAKLSVLLSIQAAELHLTNKPAGYPLAEKAAALAADKANLYSSLPPEEKKELVFKAEHARLRAVYAQAFLMYQQGRYADTMTKLTPSLAEMARTGPAVSAAAPKAKDEAEPQSAQAARRLDEFRRNEVIVLALQCRIKEGGVKEAGELFDLLKRFGGSLEASVSAMGKLIDTVEPQIHDLRKKGKAKEADDLAKGVGTLLDRVANEPNVSPAVLVFLGRGLREIGNTDKAVELLNKVPAPAEGLDKPLGELDEAKRLPVVRYRNARLELARSYRAAKKYADAEKVLADALGTKDKKGWGANDLNFRKEHAHLLEAKAAEQADPKAALPLWRDATTEWGTMGREYQAVLVKPFPADEKAKNDLERLKSQVKPIFFDLFFEQLRCATKANVQLLKAKPGDLQVKLAGAARQMADLEKKNPDLPAEVKAKFAGLMDEVPALKAEYQKTDGPKGLLRQPGAG